MAAFNKLSGNFTSQSWNSIPFERKSNTKAGNIFDLMVLCGFDQGSIYVNEEYLKKPTMNSIGVAFAKRPLVTVRP